MNQRIRELTGKALDKAVPYRWHNLDHVEVEKVMKEFAELIVRECCKFENSYGGDAGLVARSFSRKIKQHFGVEQ